MEKKKEQDILIVRDEKTGELGVISGLNKDGSPKRVPAKAEHSGDFLKFDRHGDILDNFFLNFFRQCKEPSRFGFYRIAAEQADKLLDVMKKLLKDPDANKELLASHKVDTSDYEKKAQEKQKQDGESLQPETMGQKQNTPEEQPQEKKRYQPIDENKINWQEIEEQWGVKRDELAQSGDLDKMLHHGKSNLIKVNPTFGGETFELEARLSFQQDEGGNVRLTPHFIRKEQKLDEYKGHKFSAEDKQNLRITGNLGRIVDLVDKNTGELIPSIISIDRQTNELTDMAANKLRIPTKIGKTELTSQEQDMLRAGLPVRNKLIERSDGKKFVTTLQANVERRGVEFVPGTGKSPRTAQEHKEQAGETQQSVSEGTRRHRNSWTDANGNIRPISKWKEVQFTESQKADYVAGKTVRLENATDKEGKTCTLYLKFNPEKGRPFASRQNPDKAQVVVPPNESRTQVVVNNEGKTNEATKHIREPLKNGQTEPSDSKQQARQKRSEKQEIKKSSQMKI